jgi:hypothetical protein
MNLKSLFSRKPKTPIAERAPDTERSPVGSLDLDALDACVGGRAETDGVGCYLRSEQPRVH